MSNIKDRKRLIIWTSLTFLGIGVFMFFILWKAFSTISSDGKRWREIGYELSTKKEIGVDANRGNILAEDGKLLASTIPSYKLKFDFLADGFKIDTFNKYIDSIAYTLSSVYPDISVSEAKSILKKGYNTKLKNGKRNRNFTFSNVNISYVDKKRIENSAYFNKGANKAGYFFKKQISRKKPFGSLASRTVGEVYREVGKGGYCGIEKQFDYCLKGRNGIKESVKIRGGFRDISVVEPEDGNDVVTTLDVNIQDIVENALLQKLIEVDAEKGCVVIMETNSGKIKAVSNLKRIVSGSYSEVDNFAFDSQTEPGSTFKIASAIVAIEDGVADTSTKVDTGNGIWQYTSKVRMTDWNHNKGGFGVISLKQAIAYSSNIGVAKIIDEHYKKNPSRYIERLYDMRLNQPINFEIPGTAKPIIKDTSDPLWSGTSLAWMSFGYETNIPPIYMLTFYNAIANGGKMIKPYLVKEILKNGKCVKSFSTEVIKERICSENTLKKVNEMLEGVVEFGTAKNVASKYFKIAGKTGTAQVDYGQKGKVKSHQLTFCGYFPSDDPKYSMIVVVWKPNKGYPSAGAISGEVFNKIAERVYAQSSLIHAAPMPENDSISKMPVTKDGKSDDLKIVLDELSIPYSVKGEGNNENWAFTSQDFNHISIKNRNINKKYVPDVSGMGAKDAVFLLENIGLKVKLNGKGRVYAQSLPAGFSFSKKQIITLDLK